MRVPLKIKRPVLIKKRSEKNALSLLRVKKAYLYRAAYPGYPANFSRDSLIYGMLAGDKKALHTQVAFSALHQGKKYNAATGEEPGKIHHELPAVIMNGKSTAYNACDTTALFLLAIANLYDAGDKKILKKYAVNIQAGVEYIKNHVKNRLFYEDPALCGADSFALKVTYWKDSELNHDESLPIYPIVYSLAHFQNAAAIEAIGIALKDQSLVEFAHDMTDRGVETLWAGDHFIVALDGNERRIDAPSSDSLHALLYINPDSIPDGYAKNIEKYMKRLEADAGYLTSLEYRPGIDDYHTRYVWVHEQALLHAAAVKHSLHGSMYVASKVRRYINDFSELIDPTNGYSPAGNQPQLWAVGASLYFKQPLKSLL